MKMITTTTSRHPNARLSSPKNSKSSFPSFMRRRSLSIVYSTKATSKSFKQDDDDENESYQTVSNPLQYTATEREAMDRKNSLLWQKLSPAWRVLLLSDGSVTRHLSVLGGKGCLSDDDDDGATSSHVSESNVKVEVTSMKPCARDRSQPEDVVKIKGPLVQREVYLRYDDDGNDGGPKKNKNPDPPLVYACS